jgi:hypothetical protein
MHSHIPRSQSQCIGYGIFRNDTRFSSQIKANEESANINLLTGFAERHRDLLLGCLEQSGLTFCSLKSEHDEVVDVTLMRL